MKNVSYSLNIARSLSSSELSKIGDIFYSSKDVGKGTGLGLSLCAGIVENHAGTLSFRSAPGMGFEVGLEFPVAPSDAQGDDGG